MKVAATEGPVWYAPRLARARSSVTSRTNKGSATASRNTCFWTPAAISHVPSVTAALYSKARAAELVIS
jgi:hypothetical protein